jgi:hypothetical protein
MKQWIKPGCALLALVLAACSSGTEPDQTASPVGELAKATGCKAFTASTGGFTVPSEQDCIEYEYDGESILQLRHVNAGFNCCPDTLTAVFHIQVGSIIIDEAERLDSGGCHCLCLYDLDYEIRDLPPGEYAIRVNQPYLWAGADILEFTVDLTDEPSGFHCIERDRYPWGVQ